MAVPSVWYWCPGCERAYADLRGSRESLCKHCHEEKGITWAEARTLHEEFPDSPEFDGEHHFVEKDADEG